MYRTTPVSVRSMFAPPLCAVEFWGNGGSWERRLISEVWKVSEQRIGRRSGRDGKLSCWESENGVSYLTLFVLGVEIEWEIEAWGVKGMIEKFALYTIPSWYLLWTLLPSSSSPPNQEVLPGRKKKKLKDSHSSTQSSLSPLWSGFSTWALTRWAHSSKWCFKGAHWAECSHSVKPVGSHVSNDCGVPPSGCDLRMAWGIPKFGLTVLSERWTLQYSWRSRRTLEKTKKFFRWTTSFSNRALSRQGLWVVSRK